MLRRYISIHAPHTGRDTRCLLELLRLINFDPRAPYGARPQSIRQSTPCASISIHAPHTGRDDKAYSNGIVEGLFQSTRPIRGATQQQQQQERFQGPRDFNPRAPYGARLNHLTGATPRKGISIHAPHTGRDFPGAVRLLCLLYFNPRAPYGARLVVLCLIEFLLPYFNPRAPYGARPQSAPFRRLRRRISIHAPHTGRDGNIRVTLMLGKDFNPRAPYGARPLSSVFTKKRLSFQSTRPIRGATRLWVSVPYSLWHFNPRAPYGARLDLSRNL